MSFHDIQWVGPTFPLRTGIAAYNVDFLRAVDGLWPVAPVLEKGSVLPEFEMIQERTTIDPDSPTVIHLGNSEFHERGYRAARDMEAVVVLHDVVLHHARVAMMLRNGRGREYWRELQKEYGAAGVKGGRDLLAGRDVEAIESFPLNESFVRNARTVVVHSRYAAESIGRRVPDANLKIVPMGIPIPPSISQADARLAIGIPSSAFVVASITHVNPNKRIPVVLRALRRLIARTPDVVFVMAGTGSDGEDLAREIRMMGMQDHVLQFGYVDDLTARLIAAASDACVNLRYPTTGETSASLLRLLGAGLPVLVSEAGTSLELPDGVGIKISIDKYEVEMITEVLWELGTNAGFRKDAGAAAREFVMSSHSMANEVAGYAALIGETYGLELPELGTIPVEPAPPLGQVLESFAPRGPVALISDVLTELGLDNIPEGIELGGRAIVELGLDGFEARGQVRPRTRLLERVACKLCGVAMSAEGVCRNCGAQAVTRGPFVDLRGIDKSRG